MPPRPTASAAAAAAARGRLAVAAVAAVVVVWSVAGRAAAAESACAGLERLTPKVEVAVDPGGDPEIVAVPQARIEERAAAMGRVTHGPDLATRGLTTVEQRGEFAYSLARATRPDGGPSCVALASLRAELANRDLTVLVDERYPEGSCERRAILDHELEHVRINREAVRAGGERLRSRLGELAARWEGRWLAEGGEAEIREAIEKAVDAVLDAVRAEAAARHAELDSPESYAATQRRCNSW